MMRALVIALGALCLLGCTATSPQIQHLQLSAGDAVLPEGDTLTVILDRIEIPDYLLRDELLRRESSVSLHYDATRRWAEPLDIGIQRVLGRRLKASLNTQRVILFPDAPSEPPDWQLEISVARFEATGSVALLIAEGRWTKPNEDGAPGESIVFDRSIPLTTGDGGDIASTMSRLLWLFAEQLATIIPTQPDVSKASMLDTQAMTLEKGASQ